MHCVAYPRSTWPPMTQFARCGACYNSRKNALCLTIMVGICFPARPRVVRSGVATSYQRPIPPLRHSNHRAAMPKCGLSPILSAAMKRNEVLRDMLPPNRHTGHGLRPRAHDREIPSADCLSRKTCIIRMIYQR